MVLGALKKKNMKTCIFGTVRLAVFGFCGSLTNIFDNLLLEFFEVGSVRVDGRWRREGHQGSEGRARSEGEARSYSVAFVGLGVEVPEGARLPSSMGTSL